MSDAAMVDENFIEVAAREHCARLLNSQTASLLPPHLAEGLVILAFTFGAAWALELPHLIELGNAQLDSMRAAQAGRVS